MPEKGTTTVNNATPGVPFFDYPPAPGIRSSEK